MACFTAALVEAAVVAVAAKIIEKHETKVQVSGAGTALAAETPAITWSRRLKWLRNLLVAGSVLLLFEHVWHGEIVPWFPFLTAMSDPEDTAEMLHEIATVGVGMCVAVTAVWGAMCAVAQAIVKRAPAEKAEADA